MSNNEELVNEIMINVMNLSKKIDLCEQANTNLRLRLSQTGEATGGEEKTNTRVPFRPGNPRGRARPSRIARQLRHPGGASKQSAAPVVNAQLDPIGEIIETNPEFYQYALTVNNNDIRKTHEWIEQQILALNRGGRRKKRRTKKKRRSKRKRRSKKKRRKLRRRKTKKQRKSR